MDWTGSLQRRVATDETVRPKDIQPIVDVVSGASIGVFDGIGAEGRPDRDLLPPHTPVHVAALSGRTPSDMIDACRTLRAEGFEPVPDIVPRAFAGTAALLAHLDRLCRAAGIREVVLIGPPPGNARGGSGDGTPEQELLRTRLLDGFGIATVGIAAHPSLQSANDPGALNRAVDEFNRRALRADVHLYYLTRPATDLRTLFAWEAALRRAGNRLPVHVGIAGPADPCALPALERLCGFAPVSDGRKVEPADPMLRTALTAPNRHVAALARHRQRHPQSGLRRIHLVARDGLRGPALWLDAMLRGAVSLSPEGEDFTVDFHTAA